MMQAPHDLAAFLVAQGCLPMVAGVTPSAPPPEGAPLSAEERAAAGFTEPGVTIRYKAAGADVLADYGATTATIRTPDGDVAETVAALEKAIKGSIGDMTTEEAETGPGARLRTYMIRLSERRYARVAVAIPRAARAPVEVRVTGMAAIGYTSDRASPG